MAAALSAFFLSLRSPYRWHTDNTISHRAVVRGHSSSTRIVAILRWWISSGSAPSEAVWVPTACQNRRSAHPQFGAHPKTMRPPARRYSDAMEVRRGRGGASQWYVLSAATSPCIAMKTQRHGRCYFYFRFRAKNHSLHFATFWEVRMTALGRRSPSLRS